MVNTAACRHCHYYGGSDTPCVYILHTRHRRPRPEGDSQKCPVFTSRKKKRAKRLKF